MGIILIKLKIHRLENLAEYGLVRFESNTGAYYVCHDFESYYWDILNDNAPTNLPRCVPDPDALFEIIDLTFAVSQELCALIKRPTFVQIKLSKQYNIHMIKYLLLSELLCSDINNIIFAKLFWIETHYVYTHPTQIIPEGFYRDSNSIRMFQNAVKDFPHDWMLRY